MKVEPLALPGVLRITPRVHRDDRGFFLETWAANRYAAAGIACAFVQDNHSKSVGGTLRGLHLQSRPGQAKLVRVVRGEIFDVAVDVRPDSPTFGQWVGVVLDDRAHAQLFLPVGFAHGFYVLSETAEVAYKCSAPYDPATERTLAWDDPDVGVEWPLMGAPLLSTRDQAGSPLAAIRDELAQERP